MAAVATEGPLNDSLNKAQRHYASLFFLPSTKATALGLALVSLLVSVMYAVAEPLPSGLIVGFSLGITLFGLTLVSDVILSKLILKDPIFVLRRTMVLSLFSWVFWFLFIGIGFGLSFAFGSILLVKLSLLGFAALITLRTIVLVTVSSAAFSGRAVGILLQPLVCIVPFVAIWSMHEVAPIQYLPFIVLSPVVAMLSAHFLIRRLDRIGQKTYGFPSIDLFRAFMLNWVAALNAPLESFLEKIGEDQDIEVSFLKFDASKPKAAILVPLVHPGPFKNIGSSLLPSLLKNKYDKTYSCHSSVPLGLLGHELDAASQSQNHKIIAQIIKEAEISASEDKATRFVRVSEGFVAVSCQIFGKTALLSFTLAPKTTEDLPLELGHMVQEEASKLGLTGIVVNAHNSLTQTTQIEASLDTLRSVACMGLGKALSQETYPFEVGAFTVHPPELSLKDGLGEGGITVTVVRVDEQKAAYVVIDGNNMVSRLREKILEALVFAGFQECEVFTTDTHAVSAVVVGKRGYHPIGEAINHETLINSILGAAHAAAKNLEPCRTAYHSFVVPKVRVIGSESLDSIAVLVDRTIRAAKRLLVPVFAVEGLFLILLLVLV